MATEFTLMKFEVLEESDSMIRFQLPTETHTFANLLAAELRKVEGVKIATYRVEHPLVGVPEFYVEVDGVTTRDAIKSACDAIVKLSTSFTKSVKKL
jgi:DNA-directed RNA polymerase subunit L